MSLQNRIKASMDALDQAKAAHSTLKREWNAEVRKLGVDLRKAMLPRGSMHHIKTHSTHTFAGVMCTVATNIPPNRRNALEACIVQLGYTIHSRYNLAHELGGSTYECQVYK